MDTDRLIEKIKRDGAVIFGTGFVAELFFRALEEADLADKVRFFMVSQGDEEIFHGRPVYRLGAPEIQTAGFGRENAPALCLAVHASLREEIESQLERAGLPGSIWIYPHYLRLAWGKPLRDLVWMDPRDIAGMQAKDQYWITVRFGAMRELDQGKSGTGIEIYRKAIGLFSSPETAQKRLAAAGDLVRSIREKGFDESSPILMDSRYRILDGLHRLAAALLLGLDRVPCQIVPASDRFEEYFTDDNLFTAGAQKKAGLSPSKQRFLAEARKALTGGIAEREKPEVSVILPVYDVQDYIDICMESLVGQTMKNIELLLIDDGSSDHSLDKCREWKEKDSRVIVLSSENRGVAAARNLGLEMARGTYIAFVDPDDWVEKDYLEKLWQAAEESGADYAECDLWRFDNRSGKKIYRACYGRMGRAYTLKEHMKYGPTATYKAISQKSLWEKNGVRMPECSFESPAVYSLILALSGQVASVREPLYYYRRFRENSLIENGYAGKDGSVNHTLGIEAMDFLVSEFQRTGLYDQYRDVLEGVVKYRLSDILAMQFHRKSPEHFRILSRNYKDFLSRTFPDGHNETYITWGGYNLGKILTHMNWLHDPDTRFSFSSMISLAGGKPEALAVQHKNRYRRMMIERELEGDFWQRLAEINPAYMFLDLLEERFDILALGGRYLTISDAFERASFREADDQKDRSAQDMISTGRRIYRDSPQCRTLWERCTKEVFTKIRCICPQIRFVIVENYLCETVGDLKQRQEFPDLDQIRKVNGILREYYAYLRALLPEAVWISPSGDELYFTDRFYEYGAIPSHLNEIENQMIAEKIESSL